MSKSLKVSLILFVIALIISSGFYAVVFHIPVTTITYPESEDVLINPSRGFYVQFDTGHLEGMESLRDQGVTLVLLAFDIADFVNEEISQTKLNELDIALQTVRAQGLKAILRTAYGFYDVQPYHDPKSLDIIKIHIKQLKPLFYKHQTVLLSVQAGFLGPWGEWHHSNLENPNGELDAFVINAVILSLCDAVPEPISIAVRRPDFIRKIDAALIDVSRIAFHNDAFLSTNSDMNTYDLRFMTRQQELDYINQRQVPVANGGEIPELSPYTQPDVAISEFDKLQFTYLNREYNRTVLDEWEKTDYEGQSFLKTITNRLGYRLSLKSMTTPEKIGKNQTLKLRLTLLNSGFAAPALPYEIELVVYDDEGILKSLPFKTVNLQDFQVSKSMQIAIKVDINHYPDQFKIGIRIKEKVPDLQNDTRYMIRLANDTMSFQNGINALLTYQWDGKNKYNLISY